MIIDTLIDKIKKCDNPTVVGLDTSFDYLPEGMRAGLDAFAGAAGEVFAFNRARIDAVRDIVPAAQLPIADHQVHSVDGGDGHE